MGSGSKLHLHTKQDVKAVKLITILISRTYLIVKYSLQVGSQSVLQLQAVIHKSEAQSAMFMSPVTRPD